MDCRKKENKPKTTCKIKRFCNPKENHFATAGKGIVALTNPTTGLAITAYEMGKSLIKLGACKK